MKSPRDVLAAAMWSAARANAALRALKQAGFAVVKTPDHYIPYWRQYPDDDMPTLEQALEEAEIGRGFVGSNGQRDVSKALVVVADAFLRGAERPAKPIVGTGTTETVAETSGSAEGHTKQDGAA